MDSSSIISQITIKDKVLIIFYDQLVYGLFSKFNTDDEVKTYIEESLENAFQESILKKNNSPYLLNIASTEKFGAFPWEGGWPKQYLNKQLSIFMPIIQKFIADALTDKLEI